MRGGCSGRRRGMRGNASRPVRSVFAAPQIAYPAAVRSGIGAALICGVLQIILDNE